MSVISEYFVLKLVKVCLLLLLLPYTASGNDAPPPGVLPQSSPVVESPPPPSPPPPSPPPPSPPPPSPPPPSPPPPSPPPPSPPPPSPPPPKKIPSPPPPKKSPPPPKKSPSPPPPKKSPPPPPPKKSHPPPPPKKSSSPPPPKKSRPPPPPKKSRPPPPPNQPPSPPLSPSPPPPTPTAPGVILDLIVAGNFTAKMIRNDPTLKKGLEDFAMNITSPYSRRASILSVAKFKPPSSPPTAPNTPPPATISEEDLSSAESCIELLGGVGSGDVEGVQPVSVRVFLTARKRKGVAQTAEQEQSLEAALGEDFNATVGLLYDTFLPGGCLLGDATSWEVVNTSPPPPISPPPPPKPPTAPPPPKKRPSPPPPKKRPSPPPPPPLSPPPPPFPPPPPPPPPSPSQIPSSPVPLPQPSPNPSPYEYEYTPQPPYEYEYTPQPPYEYEYTPQPPYEYTPQPPYEYTPQPPYEYTPQPPYEYEYSPQPPYEYSPQPPYEYGTTPPEYEYGMTPPEYEYGTTPPEYEYGTTPPEYEYGTTPPEYEYGYGPSSGPAPGPSPEAACPAKPVCQLFVSDSVCCQEAGITVFADSIKAWLVCTLDVFPIDASCLVAYNALDLTTLNATVKQLQAINARASEFEVAIPLDSFPPDTPERLAAVDVEGQRVAPTGACSLDLLQPCMWEGRLQERVAEVDPVLVRLTNATWAADSAGVLGDQAEENDSARLIQDMASPSLEELENALAPNTTLSWLPANITQVCAMAMVEELPEFFLEGDILDIEGYDLECGFLDDETLF